MRLARVGFGACPGGMKRDAFENLAHGYLAALLQNWQILYDYDLAWQDGQLHAYTRMPVHDSTAQEFESEWVEKARTELTSASNQEPQWNLLDDESPEHLATWDAGTSFLLYTNLLEKCSPLLCLKTGRPIALHLNAFTAEQKSGLYSWVDEFRNTDRLWIGSGGLEFPAYTQLADPNSGLSECGRDLCKTIEATTGIRTYYFLVRSLETHLELHGEPLEEYLCPGCNNDWSWPGADRFAFRCDACRMIGISH